MDETEFWQLVDSSRAEARGDAEEQADVLVERLAGLDPDRVVDFARHFESRYNRACTWDVWAAAAVLLDGADEDTFAAFRCWLIARGRELFEGAVHDPDDLAELLDGFDAATDGDADDVGYAADEAYEQLTGAELPDLGLPAPPAEPAGDPVDLDDPGALADRLPRLSARFA